MLQVQRQIARQRLICMAAGVPNPSMRLRELLFAWRKILSGRAPMLSIEITRECPLRCPGCYAFGEAHLGEDVTLRELHDLHGDALVAGVLRLVRQHRPMHVSIVGGEPLIRHRELGRILPAISKTGAYTLVVTSAVIPIPFEWMAIPRVRITVSVDGLPEDHDERRKPATYERILKNIAHRKVNIHCVVTQPMLARREYLHDYIMFWSAREEVERIWMSTYTPQIGEQSREMLTPDNRIMLARMLPALAALYPKLLFKKGMAEALLDPPRNPDDCLFAKMSVNYSADLERRVEPCVFGGAPDCSQCGCAASNALHWIRRLHVGPLRLGHLVPPSMRVGMLMNLFHARPPKPARWTRSAASSAKTKNEADLVHIDR